VPAGCEVTLLTGQTLILGSAGCSDEDIGATDSSEASCTDTGDVLPPLGGLEGLVLSASAWRTVEGNARGHYLCTPYE
jgi:hypothetical protein